MRLSPVHKGLRPEKHPEQVSKQFALTLQGQFLEAPIDLNMLVFRLRQENKENLHRTGLDEGVSR